MSQFNTRALANGRPLNPIAGGAPTPQEMATELEKLRAENAALKAAAVSRLYCKVSERKVNDDGEVTSKGGGVSLYGTGRWPITLYWEQWEAVLNFGPQIRAFIKDHKSELKTKAQAGAV